MRDDFIKGFILFSAPIHLVYEVGNSIWKDPQLSNIDAENDISSLIDLKLELIAPSKSSLRRAMRIAKKSFIPLYDALYIGLTEEVGGLLITADDKQLICAKNFVEATHIRRYPKIRGSILKIAKE